MKCPLFVKDVFFTKEGREAIVAPCLKEECAWWDSGVEQCGFLTVSEALKGIQGYLGEIMKKMPHEEQP